MRFPEEGISRQLSNWPVNTLQRFNPASESSFEKRIKQDSKLIEFKSVDQT